MTSLAVFELLPVLPPPLPPPPGNVGNVKAGAAAGDLLVGGKAFGSAAAVVAKAKRKVFEKSIVLASVKKTDRS